MIPHRQTSGRDGGARRRRRGGVAWTALAALALAAGMAVSGRAQEFNGKVVAGSATIDQGATRTTITAANNTIIDFPSFDIPAGHTVQFIQPSDTSRVLNRVTGGNPSELFGSLEANGIVYLANPAGIYFGPHAFIDVGALYAAAGNISNRDFLDQSNRFTGLDGSVVNAGLIRGRSVNLLGQTVANLGVISAPAGLVVIYDELDLPWGALRVKPKGSAAGHNGMKSLIGKLGTQEFPRVRLGVHPGHPLPSGADYLLSRFSRRQTEELDAFVDLAADATESIIAEGVEKSMTRFNGRAWSSTTEEE